MGKWLNTLHKPHLYTLQLSVSTKRCGSEEAALCVGSLSGNLKTLNSGAPNSFKQWCSFKRIVEKY